MAIFGIRLFRSIALFPPKTLQIPAASATLIHMIVHAHASPAVLPHLSIHSYKFCCDVARENTMNTTITQPLTTLELLTEDQPSTNTTFSSALELFDPSTVPTFTELPAEYEASIDKPEVAWDSRSRL
jgi:hypothetical protein